MRHEIKMKSYVIDNMIQLFLLIGFILFIISQGKNHIVICLVVVMAIMILIWCEFKEILLLPIDFICGSKERIVHFSRVSFVWNFELFEEKNYCAWKFYSSEGTIRVLVPVCLSEEELELMEKPKTDQKIKITYYPYSKILKSWEEI